MYPKDTFLQKLIRGKRELANYHQEQKAEQKLKEYREQLEQLEQDLKKTGDTINETS